MTLLRNIFWPVTIHERRAYKVLATVLTADFLLLLTAIL